MVESSWRERLRSSLRIAIWIGIGTAVVMGGLYAATQALGIPFTTLSRDPNSTLGGSWYVGGVSNAVVLVVVASAGIALFTWWVTRRHGVGALSRMLGWLGLGMLALGLDDLYRVHDAIVPGLGIPGIVLGVTYGLAALALLWKFLRTIFESTRFGLFVLAGAFLALSLFVDVVDDYKLFTFPINRLYLEDPAKIAGMFLASAYLIDSSRIAIRMKESTERY